MTRQDGRFVSANLEGSQFVAWNTATGEEGLRQKRTDKERMVLGVQLAADGKSIARTVTGVWIEKPGFDPVGPAYSAIYVTDHVSGEEFKLEPMPWSIYSGGVQFSADGTKLVIEGRFDKEWKSDGVECGTFALVGAWSTGHDLPADWNQCDCRPMAEA